MPASRRLKIGLSACFQHADPARPLDTGIVRTVWLTPAEIEASRPRHRSPLVWRCVQDHLAGRRFALDAVHMDPSAGAPG